MNNKAQAEIGVAAVCIAIIGLIVCIWGFDYVPAGKIGVLDHLGEVNPTPMQPSVKWTGMLTETIKFSTRIQLRQYDESAASNDLQTVKTKVALNFKLLPEKAPEIYKTLGENYQDTIISPIVHEAVKASTAKFTAEALIKNRTEAKSDITTTITEKLETKGLIVTEVSITDFDFSPEYNAAIERKQVAEQDAKTAENKYAEMEWTSKSMQLQSQVLEIKKLDLQKSWIDRWDGHLPVVVMGNQDIMMNMNDIAGIKNLQNRTETNNTR